MPAAIIHEIVELASELEGHRNGVHEWMREQHLYSIDGRTAMELVHSGQGTVVIEFLRRAIDDQLCTERLSHPEESRNTR